MRKEEIIPIKNEIRVEELWSGIGGYFDTLGQIINEFVDNAISNFEANNPLTRDIIITIHELKPDGDVSVSIEDSGTGIKNLDAAFSLGSHEGAETPLNEHGFGIKHALASANPNNDNWAIYTRSKKNFEDKTLIKIVCPYKLENFGAVSSDEQWPGRLNGSGTLINFVCSHEMFATLRANLQGGVYKYQTLCDILCEDLGFTYAGLIKNNRASITLIVIDSNNSTESHAVGAVEPEWDSFLKSGKNGATLKGSTKYDLGGGDIAIEYAFGFINNKDGVKEDGQPKSNKKSKKNNKDLEVKREKWDNTTTRKYYKTSMASQGVEIRVNGRILVNNLLKEVWGLDKHNAYNRFLVTIDLKTKNVNALPRTKTAKNGFRQGDAKLEALYEWIREMCDAPKKEFSECKDEVEKFNVVAGQRQKMFLQIDQSSIVETEKDVFKEIKNKSERVRLDMYERVNNIVKIYEGKIDEVRGKDVYQLRMYWDGCIFDGITPDEAYVVGARKTPAVDTIIDYLNTLSDAKGNKYNISFMYWDELEP